MNYGFIFRLWLSKVYVLDYPCFSIIRTPPPNITQDNRENAVLPEVCLVG